MATQKAGSASSKHPDIERLSLLADLLDNRFQIPGTSIRFGLDAIIGLIPYAGDLLGLLISGYLLLLLVRNGAGPLLILKMVGNYLLDAAVGAIPVLGDVFDIAFQANSRNVALLIQYYESGEARPSALKSMLLLAFVLFAILTVCTVFFIWGALLFFQWLFSL
jgi:nitrate reductase NapE component